MGASTKIKIKETFQRLCQIEQDSDFFSLSYNKIPLWVYVREAAMLAASGLIRSSGQTASSQRINLSNLIRRVFYFLINFYKLFGNEVIIFTNERHLELDSNKSRYYNQYAELVLNDTEFKKVLIFEFPTAMTRQYRRVKYDRYLPLDFVLAIKQVLSPLSFFFSRKIKKEYHDKLQRSNFWRDQEIKKILKLCVSSAYNINYYGVFLKFIKFLNPKAEMIYSCMAGYDKFPEITEIQHGLILDFHAQYIYPKIPALNDYLRQKKMIVFSNDIRDLLIDRGYFSENIKTAPNPKIYFYFLKSLEKDFFQKKLSPKILIISDWGGNFQKIFRKIVLEIEKNRKRFKDWEISLILHPTEENVYEDLNLTKVKVFENHEVSLWGILSEAVCIIGINSTVLGEATYFGCFDIILKDKELEDQKYYIDWLCKGYSHKAMVPPEEFIEWFEINEQKIINHLSTKKEIMLKHYEKFLAKNRL